MVLIEALNFNIFYFIYGSYLIHYFFLNLNCYNFYTNYIILIYNFGILESFNFNLNFNVNVNQFKFVNFKSYFNF